ncbi:hypothetical protein [Bacillus xiapuensis]|uniref:Uncharacterized protein n=1 Tax=Bacillus xiapuensis TaxID=2014075 RepID=A0ABU6NC17_9BACI|nr:hypothetical protein [Bacillus xiapuensis]
MMDFKDFYILGLPIKTNIGQCYFLKVKEYPDYFADLQIIAMTKEQIIYKYGELNKNGSLDEFINELKKLTLFEIALGIPELRESYCKLFDKAFNKKEVLFNIKVEEFTYYRSLIMAMNCLKEETINPNPEIQRAIERSRRVKQQDGENTSFADIVTSIVGYNGLSYNDINEFTIYQMYMTYYRIAQIKSYDTSTLFATVAEKVQIDSWSKHIDLFEEEKHYVTKEDFKEKSNSLFGK